MESMEKIRETGAMTAPVSWKKRLLFSAVWALILLAVSWIIWGIQFAGNDDAALMYRVSGAMTGQLEPYVYFMAPLYSAPLAWLYGITDAVPWYILSYIAAMFLSCWMICQAVMKKFAPCCQKGWMISCAIYGVLYGAFYYAACVRPQFTTIAALCGAAALALRVTAEPTDSKGERRFYGIGWIILMLLALNVRYKVGLVTLAVTLCAIGVRVLLQKKLSWRCALGLILTLGVLYGVSVGTTALYKTEDWQSYQQFNIVRSRFMDYPIAPYQDLEDVYTALGWDEPLYNMVRSWYFLDERVTESALDTIAQANLDWFGQEEQVSTLRLGGLLNTQVRPAFLVCGLWLAGLLFLTLQRIHYKKDAWRMTLLAYLPSACFLFGCVVLLVYFIWQGRVPQRIVDMTLYISLTPSLLLLPVHADPERDHTGRRGTLAASLLLALGLFITASMQNPWRLPDHTAQYAVSDAVETYCAAHEDQFFIKTSFALDTAPLPSIRRRNRTISCSGAGPRIFLPPLCISSGATGMRRFTLKICLMKTFAFSARRSRRRA